MKGFQKVGVLKEFQSGSSQTVSVGRDKVALFRVRDHFYAVADACPHAGGPLGAGPLEGSVVRCPWHGWEFDVVKGCATMSDEVALVRYEVKVEQGFVYVSKKPVKNL